MFSKLVRSLFGSEQRPAGQLRSNEPAPGPSSYRVEDDETYLENSEFMDGLEFVATLQVRTPMSVLIHHGERFKGRPSEAPQYGSQADGCWTYALRSFDELGLKPVKLDQLQASDCGLVDPREYHSFLLEFRRIVEGGDELDLKLAKLRTMSQCSERNAAYWLKLEKTYPGFPESFFYRTFTEIPGVGAKTAGALFAAGFRTPEDLASASIAQLLAVSGVGRKTAAAIRTHFDRFP